MVRQPIRFTPEAHTRKPHLQGRFPKARSQQRPRWQRPSGDAYRQLVCWYRQTVIDLFQMLTS
jgi:hypothetical protein